MEPVQSCQLDSAVYRSQVQTPQNFKAASGEESIHIPPMEEENHRAPATFKGDMLVAWVMENHEKNLSSSLSSHWNHHG